MQPESAMRGGTGKGRGKRGGECLCWRDALGGGGGLTIAGGRSDGDLTVRRGRSRQSRQTGLTKSEGCEGSGGKRRWREVGRD